MRMSSGQQFKSATHLENFLTRTRFARVKKAVLTWNAQALRFGFHLYNFRAVTLFRPLYTKKRRPRHTAKGRLSKVSNKGAYLLSSYFSGFQSDLSKVYPRLQKKGKKL